MAPATETELEKIGWPRADGKLAGRAGLVPLVGQLDETVQSQYFRVRTRGFSFEITEKR